MQEASSLPIHAWEAFYLIVGGAAGALTGLQFVVLTLVAEFAPARGRTEAISAFGTPNVVHFCAALLASCILTVPWPTAQQAGMAVSGCGGLGIVYSVVVLGRALRQRTYKPVLEDWLWHVILPVLAYVALLAAGTSLHRWPDALFVVGAAVLSLVFIGIHNAWDTVTYVTAGVRDEEESKDPQQKVPAAGAGGTGIDSA
jgi:hypothetical protein